MATTVAEFAEETAYERYVLEHSAAFMPTGAGRCIIDLGDSGTSDTTLQAPPTTVTVFGTDGTQSYDGSGEIDARIVRAMVFGAAWKVLDLVIELNLNQGPNKMGRYQIKEKVEWAASGNISTPSPFTSIPEVWDRVLAAYAGTTGLRHSLVHRRLQVDKASGTMTATPDPKDPPSSPMTVDEQIAFCRIADGVAQAIVTGELPSRQVNSMKWLLDQLVAHHAQPLFGVPNSDGVIPEVVIRPVIGPANDITVDFDSVRRRALQARADVSYFDLQIHLQNGLILLSHLENVPAGTQTFSIEELPDWIRWA